MSRDRRVLRRLTAQGENLLQSCRSVPDPLITSLSHIPWLWTFIEPEALRMEHLQPTLSIEEREGIFSILAIVM